MYTNVVGQFFLNSKFDLLQPSPEQLIFYLPRRVSLIWVLVFFSMHGERGKGRLLKQRKKRTNSEETNKGVTHAETSSSLFLFLPSRLPLSPFLSPPHFQQTSKKFWMSPLAPSRPYCLQKKNSAVWCLLLLKWNWEAHWSQSTLSLRLPLFLSLSLLMLILHSHSFDVLQFLGRSPFLCLSSPAAAVLVPLSQRCVVPLSPSLLPSPLSAFSAFLSSPSLSPLHLCP
mmetsp:Transcript_32189/g.63841  ORF Transcript_32189/g.63841 Transcript_32189/m.63841 type:complete len:228 (+) Transcript_32189:528-1211(+)